MNCIAYACESLSLATMLTVIHTSWNASNCLSECKQYYFVQDAYFNWEMYIFHGSGSVVDHLRAPIQCKGWFW